MESIVTLRRSELQDFLNSLRGKVYKCYESDLDKYRFYLNDRYKVEKDPNFIQPIPYCVVWDKDLGVLVTKRTKKQTEVRLHDRYSIGVGGHIDSEDVLSEGLIRSVYNCIGRELGEELDLSKFRVGSIVFEGIINCFTEEVNLVHLGLLYFVEVRCKDPNIINERDKMTGEWVKVEDLDNYLQGKSLENWSEYSIYSVKSHILTKLGFFVPSNNSNLDVPLVGEDEIIVGRGVASE